jgi:anti-sigma regulatory factor (Ser/Thr protein kinase)
VAPDRRRWEATFPPEAQAVKASRVAVNEFLVGAGIDAAVIARAVLVVSEIAGNAVRHARTDFTASVSVEVDLLRLSVFDRDTRPPALMVLDSESTSGRGLHIVAAIAADWGWQTAASDDGISGKTVWAEMALDAGE